MSSGTCISSDITFFLLIVKEFVDCIASDDDTTDTWIFILPDGAVQDESNVFNLSSRALPQLIYDDDNAKREHLERFWSRRRHGQSNESFIAEELCVDKGMVVKCRVKTKHAYAINLSGRATTQGLKTDRKEFCPIPVFIKEAEKIFLNYRGLSLESAKNAIASSLANSSFPLSSNDEGPNTIPSDAGAGGLIISTQDNVGGPTIITPTATGQQDSVSRPRSAEQAQEANLIADADEEQEEHGASWPNGVDRDSYERSLKVLLQAQTKLKRSNIEPSANEKKLQDYLFRRSGDELKANGCIDLPLWSSTKVFKGIDGSFRGGSTRSVKNLVKDVVELIINIVKLAGLSMEQVLPELFTRNDPKKIVLILPRKSLDEQLEFAFALQRIGHLDSNEYHEVRMFLIYMFGKDVIPFLFAPLIHLRTHRRMLSPRENIIMGSFHMRVTGDKIVRCKGWTRVDCHTYLSREFADLLNSGRFVPSSDFSPVLGDRYIFLATNGDKDTDVTSFMARFGNQTHGNTGERIMLFAQIFKALECHANWFAFLCNDFPGLAAKLGVDADRVKGNPTHTLFQALYNDGVVLVAICLDLADGSEEWSCASFYSPLQSPDRPDTPFLERQPDPFPDELAEIRCNDCKKYETPDPIPMNTAAFDSLRLITDASDSPVALGLVDENEQVTSWRTLSHVSLASNRYKGAKTKKSELYRAGAIANDDGKACANCFGHMGQASVERCPLCLNRDGKKMSKMMTKDDPRRRGDLSHKNSYQVFLNYGETSGKASEEERRDESHCVSKDPIYDADPLRFWGGPTHQWLGSHGKQDNLLVAGFKTNVESNSKIDDASSMLETLAPQAVDWAKDKKKDLELHLKSCRSKVSELKLVLAKSTESESRISLAVAQAAYDEAYAMHQNVTSRLTMRSREQGRNKLGETEKAALMAEEEEMLKRRNEAFKEREQVQSAIEADRARPKLDAAQKRLADIEASLSFVKKYLSAFERAILELDSYSTCNSDKCKHLSSFLTLLLDEAYLKVCGVSLKTYFGGRTVIGPHGKLIIFRFPLICNYVMEGIEKKAANVLDVELVKDELRKAAECMKELSIITELMEYQGELTPELLDVLEKSIQRYEEALLRNYPDGHPWWKGHMIICHVIEIAKFWGFIGRGNEQGNENLHAYLKTLRHIFRAMKDEYLQVQIMDQYKQSTLFEKVENLLSRFNAWRTKRPRKKQVNPTVEEVQSGWKEWTGSIRPDIFGREEAGKDDGSDEDGLDGTSNGDNGTGKMGGINSTEDDECDSSSDLQDGCSYAVVKACSMPDAPKKDKCRRCGSFGHHACQNEYWWNLCGMEDSGNLCLSCFSKEHPAAPTSSPDADAGSSDKSKESSLEKEEQEAEEADVFDDFSIIEPPPDLQGESLPQIVTCPVCKDAVSKDGVLFHIMCTHLTCPDLQEHLEAVADDGNDTEETFVPNDDQVEVPRVNISQLQERRKGHRAYLEEELIERGANLERGEMSFSDMRDMLRVMLGNKNAKYFKPVSESMVNAAIMGKVTCTFEELS